MSINMLHKLTFGQYMRRISRVMLSYDSFLAFHCLTTMNEEVDYEEDIDPAAADAVEDRRSRGGGGSTADEIKRKGRGHNQTNQQNNEDHSFQNSRGDNNSSRVQFENIQRGKGAGPLQC